MNYLTYALDSGRITQRGSCREEDFLIQPLPDEGVIAGYESPLTHYVDVTTKTPVPFPSKPSPDHQWDWPTHSWTVEVSTALVRRQAELKAKRDQIIVGGFTWDGHRFDSDEISQARILGAFTSAVNSPEVFPVNWRLADNSWLALTALDMVSVWTALQTHIATCFSVFAAHEAGLNAQTDVAGVQTYDIKFGW